MKLGEIRVSIGYCRVYENDSILSVIENADESMYKVKAEKKKNEILQMLLLNPKFAMLDEIDSGLDVDAIQVVASVIKKEQEENHRGFLIVSHYARLYDLINVDRAVVLVNGKVVTEGGRELIKKIDTEGYEWLRHELGIEFEKEEKMSSVSIGSCATKEALKAK